MSNGIVGSGNILPKWLTLTNLAKIFLILGAIAFLMKPGALDKLGQIASSMWIIGVKIGDVFMKLIDALIAATQNVKK